MAEIIVDPTNENVAIVDGELANALRAAFVADPSKPTMAELKDARVIGYVKRSASWGSGCDR